MVPTGGLEPPTKRLEVFCAIQLRHVGKMAGVAGFGPAKSRSQSPLPYHLATPQVNFL